MSASVALVYSGCASTPVAERLRCDALPVSLAAFRAHLSQKFGHDVDKVVYLDGDNDLVTVGDDGK